MADLSDRQIECLVSLVEMRLVELSRVRGDQCADYRELQHCRIALLTMAGDQRRSATLAALTRRPRPRPKGHHLRPIDGGKA